LAAIPSKGTVQMRDPKRIDKIVNKLRQAWYTHPDLRLGQLVSLVAAKTKTETFDLEDEQLEEALESITKHAIRNACKMIPYGCTPLPYGVNKQGDKIK
jgi:uncharacterized protein YihD (DUF1040 family)